ncbi:MAG: ankyrin repeat domain-containing protein [Planctomycetota bacterium]
MDSPSLAELRRAVRHGDVPAAQVVLEAEPALARARGFDGGSLLLEAREREDAALVELFLTVRGRTGGEDLDVHEAAALGRPGALRRALTDDPLSAEEVGPAGFLPLHRAAFAGDPDGVMLLLETGADANARSENGARLTPLHSAVAGAARRADGAGALPVVEVLLAGGADRSATMSGEWTPTRAAERDGLDVLANRLA